MASGISTSSMTPGIAQLAACGSTSNVVSRGHQFRGREKMTHTPGPWAWDKSDDWAYPAKPNGPVYPVHVASYEKKNGPFYVALAETESDARLIASAPDLLAALRALMDKLGGDFDMALAAEKALACAAIARAEED